LAQPLSTETSRRVVGFDIPELFRDCLLFVRGRLTRLVNPPPGPPTQHLAVQGEYETVLETGCGSANITDQRVGVGLRVHAPRAGNVAVCHLLQAVEEDPRATVGRRVTQHAGLTVLDGGGTHSANAAMCPGSGHVAGQTSGNKNPHKILIGHDSVWVSIQQVGEQNNKSLSKEMRTMGSFGLDFGTGLNVVTRWLQVMFGINLGVG